MPVKKERKQKKLLEMMSDSSAMVKQSTRDPKFKGSKQADARTGRNKTMTKICHKL